VRPLDAASFHTITLKSTRPSPEYPICSGSAGMIDWIKTVQRIAANLSLPCLVFLPEGADSRPD
jgi:hypothetical protein